MTPSEMTTVRKEFSALWPHSKLTDIEWSVVFEKAGRINIGTDQASAALRNLKATIDTCPPVSRILAALKAAEPAAPIRAPQPETGGWGHRADEMLNENGLTSFEQRVIDDPKFHEYAKKIGRLDAARLKEIRAKAGAQA